MPQFNSDRADANSWNRDLNSPDEVPRGMLEEFPAEPGFADGVAVESLEPGTILEVTTRNTRYRLTVIDGGGHALITGGALFPQPTEVHIEGATAGGSALKLGWIGVGLRLELSIGRRLITTSAVQSVEPIAA
jgi:hypothetical protein